ncbi:RNA polymerase sigma-70 factor [Emticicia sp. W12TSBA100-4]|uniref:RNA polymerase sigma-70 factor n=1 Tax=Emticicia sp. W12TSBA100-4 TaxID=3160965 RepID=UPI0033067A81
MLHFKHKEDTTEKDIISITKFSEETKVISEEYFIEKTFVESPQKGFELLFRKYYTNLCNHAIRFVYSKEMAEDIVAEVFTNFWQNKIYENITTSYRSYLYTSVRYRAYNTIKNEINRTTNLENNEFDFQYSDSSVVLQPDEILHFHELTKKLETSIQNLPQQSRKAFQLNRLEGKKYTEVALEMQITVSAVERLISRALAKIRQELKSEWILGAVLWIFLN